MPTVSASTLPLWAAAASSRRPSASQAKRLPMPGSIKPRDSPSHGRPAAHLGGRETTSLASDWTPQPPRDPPTSPASTVASPLLPRFRAGAPPLTGFCDGTKLRGCPCLGERIPCLQSSVALERMRNTWRHGMRNAYVTAPVLRGLRNREECQASPEPPLARLSPRHVIPLSDTMRHR
jgi:hypothetical protein